MRDYIKRDSVLNDIGELFTLCYETLPNECGHHFIVEKELKIHWDYVKGLPAADVRENKHGEWIGYPECLKYPNAYSGDHIVCSNCEECFSVLDNCTERFDFCPHCGAVMDGGDEQ